MRPRTERQEKVLEALRQHGEWYAGCGWVWDTPSGTRRVMDALVKRGDAVVVSEHAPYGGRKYGPERRSADAPDRR